jgi:DNA methylase
VPTAELLHRKPVASTPGSIEIGASTVELADAMERYDAWPAPTCIIVDGPYGVSGFPGDPPTTHGLAEWYAPHAAAWARHALPSTTLWFWGTELSWAVVHPVLELHGWDYRSAHIWDKGVAHIAGNVNGSSIRRIPVVTEVCVQYTRRVVLQTGDGNVLRMREWLRKEWQRSGLPLYRTNDAAGVRNAATRKWFTQDHLWYYPPPEAMEALAAYATEHGKPTTWPYFSLDGETPLTAAAWATMRAKWRHAHGVTNVWREPAVRGAERVRHNGRIVHQNQKPLRLVEMSIRACTDEDDIVWEPFGGLCTATIAALRLGRKAYAAEINPRVFEAAAARLRVEGATLLRT